MPNKNYISGRRFEYKVKKFYERIGFFVVRTAGSHSPIDLIAFRKNGTRKPIFIQCKYKRGGNPSISDKDREVLVCLRRALGVETKIAYNNKKGLIFFEVVE